MSEKKNKYTLRAEINYTGVMKTKNIELKTENTDDIHIELKKICDSLIIAECDFLQITVLTQKVSKK